jgi:hypothetical protein
MPYKAGDEITLTFSGLKQAQNEAFQQGVAYAANRIERFFKDDPNVEKILEFLSLLENVKLYAEGDEEECSCDSDCGEEGCGFETDHEEPKPICLCGSEGCEA